MFDFKIHYQTFFHSSSTNLHCDLGLINPIVRHSLQDLVLSDSFEHVRTQGILFICICDTMEKLLFSWKLQEDTLPANEQMRKFWQKTGGGNSSFIYLIVCMTSSLGCLIDISNLICSKLNSCQPQQICSSGCLPYLS